MHYPAEVTSTLGSNGSRLRRVGVKLRTHEAGDEGRSPHPTSGGGKVEVGYSVPFVQSDDEADAFPAIPFLPQECQS
jgi:hypothetical protein